MFKLTGVSESKAQAEQQKVFQQKLKTGYVDIDDQNYSGPVTTLTVRSDMENEPGGISKPKPKKKTETAKERLARLKTAKEAKAKPKEGVVVCIDNAGMEDKFDKGIEYVFEAHSESVMIWVYDKEGKKQECFSERFDVVDEGLDSDIVVVLVGKCHAAQNVAVVEPLPEKIE